MRYLLVSFLFIIHLSLLLSSCKKGCTNPNADNYDPKAKEDDASCLSCDSTLIATQQQTNSTQDFTPGSPFYGNYVLTAVADFSVSQYRGNGCRQAGKVNICDNGSPFTGFEAVNVTLYNNTQRTMQVSARIIVWDNVSSLIFDTTFADFVIPPSSFITPFENIPMGCITNSFINPVVSIPSSYFTY
jgi:hypothetical protein